MNPIFKYDNGAPIAFYIDARNVALGQRIVQHGGDLTSALQAQIHLGSRREAIIFPMNPNITIMRPAWVADSIREGRMLPVYPYLDDPAQDMLQNLSVEHRDVMELLKARIGNSADSVFSTLHQKFPHNSTQMWRALYQTSQDVIQFALARFVPANQVHLNTTLLPIFPQPALPLPMRQRSPGDLDMAGRNYAPAPPNEEQDNGMVEDQFPNGFDNYQRTPSEVSFRPPSDTPSGTPQQQARPDFIRGNQDEGEEEATDDDDDDDDDDEYADSGRMSETPDEVRPPRQKGGRIGRGLRLTQFDYERMARFVMTLDHEPGLPDWLEFWNMDPVNQNRSFAAWNIQYYMKKDEITAVGARLRARAE